jgi:hypothetical protein
MCYRFIAGAAEVHVPECVVIWDTEVRATLWGEVYMATA